MRTGDQKAENVHAPRTGWLLGIGQQLRAEYAFFEQSEPMPERLLALVKQVEEDKQASHPAPMTPATNSVDLGVRGASVVRLPLKKRPQRRPEALPSHGMGELGKFEKLILDLFESNLQYAAREAAIRKLTAYMRVCHAALQSRVIDHTDVDALLH